uniref:Uncharacterized protein n=1 Tax=Arundo donax TaxID=35708 RepID=A0A0A9FHA5_ARUDO
MLIGLHCSCLCTFSTETLKVLLKL